MHDTQADMSVYDNYELYLCMISVYDTIAKRTKQRELSKDNLAMIT